MTTKSEHGCAWGLAPGQCHACQVGNARQITHEPDPNQPEDASWAHEHLADEAVVSTEPQEEVDHG